MRVRKVTVHGRTRYLVETYVGGRKRQFFKTKEEAEKVLVGAKKDQKDLGNAYRLLSTNEKAKLMGFYSDLRASGMSLDAFIARFRSLPHTGHASSIKNAVKELIASKRAAGRTEKHLKNYQWYLSRFMAGRESMSVSSITERELNDWFAARNESPRSRRQHIGLFSGLFDYCVRKRYISENPCKRLERVTIVRTVPPIFTPAQCRKVLKFAHAKHNRLLAWLTLALFCGMRPESEADHITWKDIDLARGRIVIQKSKIRSHRIIDLAFCPPALPWLQLARKLKSKLPIRYSVRRSFLRRIRQLLKLKKWPQDVFRHTAASYLLAYHQDAGKVAAFLGNSAGTLLRDYKALVFKEDAEKFMGLVPP